MRTRISAAVLLFLPLCAQPVIAVHAGRLVDVRTGSVRNNVFIAIRGDRIDSVASAAPAGATVIDLSRHTVLPGLCDCHAHILGDPKEESPIAPLLMSSAQAALWGAHNLRDWLDRGFTMVRDAGESDLGYAQVALRDSIRMGLIAGPRLQVAGNVVSVTGGHGDADMLAPDQELPRRPNIADTVPEVARAVRRDIKFGADWIKLMATGGVMDPMSDYNSQELSGEQMSEAVQVARRAGKRVMAHAHGTSGIRAAVEAGVDSIEHGTLLDNDTAALMARKGTWLIPTLYTLEHTVEIGTSRGASPASVEKGKSLMKIRRAGFDAALRNNVRIVYGVDLDVALTLKEFDALVRYGMSPLKAIQAATVNAAEMLRIPAGAIEPGKFADMIAIDGDPLTDIRAMERVVFVMKGGEVVRSTARK